MKKRIMAGAVVCASLLIIISFFMPWAKVVTSVTGVSKELASTAKGKLGGIPAAKKLLTKFEKVTTEIGELGDVKVKMAVSGYDVPVMVNNKTSKVAISLMEILTRSKKNLELKSYLVYLLPILGIVCAVLAVGGLKNKILVIIMLALSGVISIAGLYNLSTINISNIAVQVTIEKGLWYTMYSFLFIFLVGITWLVIEKGSKD